MATTALITGASSGIGAAFARLLAKDGHDLILVARRAERLQALAEELRNTRNVRVEVLPSDLAAPGAPAALAAEVAARGLQVDWLINNAGLGHHGAFLASTAEDDARLIDLNVTALTAMTREFLPGMAERRTGAVINVASTAAFQPIPYFSVYAATKAFVLSFSEGLAEEVGPQGIRVLCLCPGPTKSEFVEQAQFKTDLINKAPMMEAEEVAALALRGLKDGKTLVVAGAINALQAAAPRFFPRGLVTKISGALFKPNR